MQMYGLLRIKRQLLIGIAVFSCCNAYCQNFGANWTFGDSAGLTFSELGISSFKSSAQDYEASATISDSVGSLLFYTNGEKVWNKGNNVMINGDGLEIGSISDVGSSITLGVLIIPKPGSDSLYYIFQLQDVFNKGIRYSEVNMNLDGGFGDISQKNLLLYDINVTEKMQAVKHANGRDWWLIAHRFPNVGAGDDSLFIFVTFLVTSSGISGPYEQHYGPNAFTDELYGGWGEMCISKDGSKLIYTRVGNLDTYDFDRCTGQFSNLKTISNLPHVLDYGCSISPDNNMVYVSNTCGGDFLYQFCMSCDSNIDSTRKIVFENIYNNYCIGQHEMGPDNKIYISVVYQNLPIEIYTSKNMNLCVINEPDKLFPACNFDTLSIFLGGQRSIAGLPNMPNYNLGALIGSGCDTLDVNVAGHENNNTIRIYPNPAASIITVATHLNNYINTSLEIFSVTGERVLQQDISSVEQPVNTSALPPGIYSIRIKQDNENLFAGSLIIAR